MRRIVVATFTSLDGVIQAPGGPQEDPTGGVTLGGWVAPYFDEALGASMGERCGFKRSTMRVESPVPASCAPHSPTSRPPWHI
jgi:hypothetical protein